MASYYTVVTGEGGEMGSGIQRYETALKLAQETADRLGEPCYISGPGIDDDGSDECIGEEVATVDAAMVAAIEGGGETVTGGREATEVAREWVGAGLSAEQAEAYIAAGCWDPDVVAEMVAAGVSAADLASDDLLRQVVAVRVDRAIECGRVVDAEMAEDVTAWVTDGSLAYATSNRDIEVSEIAAAVAALRGEV